MSTLRDKILKQKFIIGYILIATFLLLVLGWQYVGHLRFRKDKWDFQKMAAMNSASDLGRIIRTLAHQNIIHRARLEKELNRLTMHSWRESVAVLNAAGDVIAYGGKPIEAPTQNLLNTRYSKDDRKVVAVSKFESLDSRAQTDASRQPVVVWDGEDQSFFQPGRSMFDNIFSRSNLDTANAVKSLSERESLSEEEIDTFLTVMRNELFGQERTNKFKTLLRGEKPTPNNLSRSVESMLFNSLPRGKTEVSEMPSPVFSEMSTTEYKKLVETQGVDWCLVEMGNALINQKIKDDIKARAILAVLTTLAALGLALALRYTERASRFEMSLLRERELNAHLREMNLAAVGLAHETKNPLNIIRGHAQIIGDNEKIPADVITRSTAIVEESDRVTSRLNQFMAYSKPIEPKLMRCDAMDVARDVAKTLSMVAEDKGIEIKLDGNNPCIMADPDLLRQVLFNLMLNAANALKPGGRIEVRMEEESQESYSLIVSDNGPGVPKEERDSIFLPYYSRSGSGIGLGLAIVRQIVLAHRWDISCGVADIGGACFRISGLVASKDSRT